MYLCRGGVFGFGFWDWVRYLLRFWVVFFGFGVGFNFEFSASYVRFLVFVFEAGFSFSFLYDMNENCGGCRPFLLMQQRERRD